MYSYRSKSQTVLFLVTNIHLRYECKEVCAHCQYRDHFLCMAASGARKGFLPSRGRSATVSRNASLGVSLGTDDSFLVVKQSRYLFGRQAPTGSLTGFLRRSGQPPRHPSLPPRPSGPLPPSGPSPPSRFDLSPSGPPSSPSGLQSSTSGFRVLSCALRLPLSAIWHLTQRLGDLRDGS